MVVKYSNWTQKWYIPRPSKIYPNGDFWSENVLFGNPGAG
jgi:hypothetical protein